MGETNIAYILLALLAAGVCIALANALGQRRASAGTAFLVSILVAGTWWLVSAAFQASSSGAASQSFWIKAQYPAMAVLPTLWLLFSLVSRGNARRIPPRYFVLFAIEPALSILLAWTNPSHALTWDLAARLDGLPITLLQPAGPWGWIHLGYSLLLYLTGAILLLHAHRASSGFQRGAAWAMVGGGLLAGLGFGLEALKPGTGSHLHAAPLIVVLGSWITVLGVIRFRLSTILPMAHETAIEHICDAILVLDPSNRIVDINLAARELLGPHASEAIGQPIENTWPSWPGEVTLPVENFEVVKEVSLIVNGTPRSYDMRISSLFNHRNKLNGRLVVLRDMTPYKRAEEALSRRDEILDAIGFVAEQFMQNGRLEDTLPDVFARLGEATHVSRVFLLENQTAPDGSMVCLYRHEWAAWGIKPQISDPILQTFSMYERGLARWVDLLKAGKVIHDHQRNLPASEQLFLQGRGVRSLVVVPIFLNDMWWGSLGFEDCRIEREWRAVEIDALRTAANTVGAALQRRQAEDASHRWAEVIQTLLDLSEIIGSTLDIPQVMSRVILAARTLLPVDRSTILLWDEQKAALLPAQTSLDELNTNDWPAEVGEYLQRFTLTPENVPLIGTLQRQKEAIAIQSAAHHPQFPAELSRLFHISSLLAVPIVFHDRLTGVLYVDYTHAEHLFTLQEINLATALARQAGLALERARLYTQAQQDADELSTLYRASSKLLTTGNDLQALAQQITDVVTEEFSSAYCSILLVEKEHNRLRPLAQHGFFDLQEVPLPLDGAGLTVNAAITGEVIYSPDVTQDERYLQASARTRSEIAIPLHAGDEVIAVLNLESPEVDAFNERSRRILSLFSDDAALALQNVRLYNATQIHARQMALLNVITHSALQQSEMHKMLVTVANRMNELIHSDHCYITLWDDRHKRASPGGASGELNQRFLLWNPDPGQPTLTGAVLEAGKAITIADVSQSGYLLPDFGKKFPAVALLGLPMVIGAEHLGAVVIGFGSPHTFTRREIAVCQQAADQVAIVVENARLYQEARQAAERRTILHRVSQEIVMASLDAEKIYAAIHKAAAQLMPAEAFAITLITPNNTQAEAVYLVDKDGRVPAQLFPKEQGLTGKVLEAGKTLYIPDVSLEADFPGMHFGAPEHTCSVLALPLRAGDRFIGMLSAQSYQPDAYTPEDGYLLEMLAATAAVALENTRLLKEIQWLAITDPLTGLYNRRGLFEVGEREVDRYRRFRRPFCVFLLDIDMFKLVNDSYGHYIGDQVLLKMTESLQSQSRDIDILGRYGGEELVMILPETGLEQAIQVAERARIFVQDHPFSTDRGEISVTISIGVAEMDPSTHDLATLIDRADKAMYAAKQAGRNRVQVYEK